MRLPAGDLPPGTPALASSVPLCPARPPPMCALLLSIIAHSSSHHRALLLSSSCTPPLIIVQDFEILMAGCVVVKPRSDIFRIHPAIFEVRPLHSVFCARCDCTSLLRAAWYASTRPPELRKLVHGNCGACAAIAPRCGPL